MNRLTRALRAGAVAISLLVALTASVPVKPWTFNPGQTAQSSQVNADFDTLYAVLNGQLDSSNISNVRGIYASQVIPATGGQATFGSAIGYTFAPQSAGQIPLTLAGVGGQTADLFDVDLTLGGTKAAWVDSAGVLHTNQPMATSLAASRAVVTDGSGNLAAAADLPALLSGGQTIAGVKTFSSAPVLSGASITTATIPRASLVALAANRAVITDGSGNDAAAADLPVLLSGVQTIAGAKTFSTSITSAGLLASSGSVGNTGGGSTMYVTALSSLDNPGVGAGDFVIQRSGSTGQFWVGGSTANVKCDFGLTTGGVWTCNKPFTSTGAGTFVGLTAGTGTAQGSSNGSTVSYYAPVYTLSGAASGSTSRFAEGRQTLTLAGGCAVSSNCVATGNTVSLSGFSATPVCHITGQNATAAIFSESTPSNTGFTINMYNASTSSSYANGATVTVDILCVTFT